MISPLDYFMNQRVILLKVPAPAMQADNKRPGVSSWSLEEHRVLGGMPSGRRNAYTRYFLRPKAFRWIIPGGLSGERSNRSHCQQQRSPCPTTPTKASRVFQSRRFHSKKASGCPIFAGRPSHNQFQKHEESGNRRFLSDLPTRLQSPNSGSGETTGQMARRRNPCARF
ncbi:MAG: hypothetical protein KIPDCIKN_01911 [Haliscomenobacter sp.]|nr:hypothetical protein [Haliscomenobacter sp.]